MQTSPKNSNYVRERNSMFFITCCKIDYCGENVLQGTQSFEG